jgi:hypothetical protein
MFVGALAGEEVGAVGGITLSFAAGALPIRVVIIKTEHAAPTVSEVMRNALRVDMN